MKVLAKKPRLPQIKLQLVRESRATYEPQTIRTPGDVEKFLGWLRHEAEEVFLVLHLNAKSEVIGMQEVSRGTLSSSLVHPREVFKGALINNTYSILCAHNHPGGSSTPSSEDMQVTRQLLDAGKLLGVSLVDHTVVGDSTYSIRENHSSLWFD